jgi:hypothetical protein
MLAEKIKGLYYRHSGEQGRYGETGHQILRSES